MDKLGYHCDVIAPSLIPRKPGDKRKNDHRDSKKLAENYAKGLLTLVHPPTKSEESIRGLVRCHLAMKNSEKRIKNQINAYLLSKGHRWPKSKWTLEHLNWLSTLELCDEYSHMVLEEYLGHLEYITTRVQALTQEIENLLILIFMLQVLKTEGLQRHRHYDSNAFDRRNYRLQTFSNSRCINGLSWLDTR